MRPLFLWLLLLSEQGVCACCGRDHRPSGSMRKSPIKLQDPLNGRVIHCDDSLKKVSLFGECAMREISVCAA